MVNKTNVQAAPTTISIPNLRKDFKDRVIAPGDTDYDKARTVFYGGVDRHPAVIIKVADANDVSRVIYLVRKYGLTVDSLLAAEVVTAYGQILQVDEKNHPDLFWAIRGGGGNFGVATRFQDRGQELAKVDGGGLFLPAR